jgi:hypothetical protein
MPDTPYQRTVARIAELQARYADLRVELERVRVREALAIAAALDELAAARSAFLEDQSDANFALYRRAQAILAGERRVVAAVELELCRTDAELTEIRRGCGGIGPDRYFERPRLTRPSNASDGAYQPDDWSYRGHDWRVDGE